MSEWWALNGFKVTVRVSSGIPSCLQYDMSADRSVWSPFIRSINLKHRHNDRSTRLLHQLQNGGSESSDRDHVTTLPGCTKIKVFVFFFSFWWRLANPLKICISATYWTVVWSMADISDNISYSHRWEGYFGNVIGYRLQVTLLKM